MEMHYDYDDDDCNEAIYLDKLFEASMFHKGRKVLPGEGMGWAHHLVSYQGAQMGFIPVKCNPYEIGGEMETGGKVWPGARILQRIFLGGPTPGNLDTSFSNPNPVPLNFTPRTVLELGAGCGLLSVVAARLGATGAREGARPLRPPP